MQKWIRGNKPPFSSFKKINISEAEADALAVEGASIAYAYFGKRLYYPQSVILGVAVSDEYTHGADIEPSQSGKSFLLAIAAVYLAYTGKIVNIGAGKDDNAIIKKIPALLSSASAEIIAELTDPETKIEKLNTQISRNGLGFKNGGKVQTFSFGSNFKDPRKNQAIGLSGDVFIVDESALVGAEFDEAFSRALALNDDTGRRGKVIEISNPHRDGRFREFMEKKSYSNDEFVMWYGADTLLATGAETSEGLAKRFPDQTSRIYQVNIEGNFVALSGLIFKPWKKYTGDFSEAHLLGFGVDFGVGHASAIVAEYITDDGEFIFRELFYGGDTTISRMAEIMKDIITKYGKARFICDTGGGGSALILEAGQAGVPIIPVVKGAGSVDDGLTKMDAAQDKFSYVGKNIEKELGLYQWSTDRNGNSLGKPVKINDDIMDAIRYVFTTFMFAQSSYTNQDDLVSYAQL